MKDKKYKNLSWLTMSSLGRVFQFKIDIGSDVFEAVSEAVSSNEIGFGVIVNSCGSLQNATFRNVKKKQDEYPITKDNLVCLKVDTPMEITSLSGWVYNKSGNQNIHIHCSASIYEDDKTKVFGGHLLEAKAGPKMVITLQEYLNDGLVCEFDKQCKKIDLMFHEE